MRQPATPRHAWPLYVVLRDRRSRLRLHLDSIMLISASFSFAREVCFQFNRIAGRYTLNILRVTHVTRNIPVSCQSSTFVHTLDRHWSRPPSLTSAAYCQLCMELRRNEAGPEHWVQGFYPSLESTICQQQRHQGSPVCSHQHLLLNTITETWQPRSSAKAALHSAKLAWIGPWYFKKVMRQRLPVEILETIAEIAVCHQEICRMEPETDTFAGKSEANINRAGTSGTAFVQSTHSNDVDVPF